MLKPLFDNILIETEDQSQKQDGGIAMPETVSPDRPEIGTVSAIGDDVSYVRVGERVAFRKYSPDIVEYDGKKHTLLKEEDVIAVIE